MSASIEPILITQRRACDLLGCGRTKLWQLKRDGLITARRLGKKTMIEMTSLRRFIAELPPA